jgi:hypothetical protein
MTVVSLAQAASRLGIAAKTLHRWLADAKLPQHRDPHDARTKGVCEEDLHLLATLHQRRLAGSCEPEPAQLPGPHLAWPADLRSLPEQLAALHTQLLTLSQQVTTLTALLQQHAPAPESPVAPTTAPHTRRRAPTAASSASRTRPEVRAKAPHQPVHVIARVEYGGDGHDVVICPKHGVLPFEPETAEWHAWLDMQSSFRFVGKLGHFTAHHWWRVPRGAWRAHRQIRNHSYNLRLAPSPELTIAILEQAAEALQAQLK